jgi:hypothetical protein
MKRRAFQARMKYSWTVSTFSLAALLTRSKKPGGAVCAWAVV